MARRLSSRSVQLGSGFTAMAATILATTGCVTDEPTREAVPTYCVRATDEAIVDSVYCDGEDDHDHNGAVIPYLIAYGNGYPHGLRPGTKIPAGGTRISHTDQNARAAVGLPTTGGFGTQAAKIAGDGNSGGAGG